MISSKAIFSSFALTFFLTSLGASSPDDWTEREHLERMEGLSWNSLESVQLESSNGLISCTASPIAAYAGVEALKNGGTAADAAATVALTQIATQLGSVASYAGVFTLLYYDASERRVYSLDAGYNSYLDETDPLSIPASDLGPLAFENDAPKEGLKGRMTLVPGFMAGVEAMHERFGSLPFSDLFSPAIWYAENGVSISPTLASFFDMRKDALDRTSEGRTFLYHCNEYTPKLGEIYKQPQLAETLRAAAKEGARYFYKGEWAEEFVRIVRREGGTVRREDLSRYKPTWSEPLRIEALDHEVYAAGPPHLGAYSIVAGLNLVEARQLSKRGPYWNDRRTFTDLNRITQIFAAAPQLDPSIMERFRNEKIDTSPDAFLTKEFASSVASIMDTLRSGRYMKSTPKHSNAIVAIDKFGNIAAVTHTINTVVWGSSGIVVGGIPIPDSAGFQQQALSSIEPGDRLPHQIVNTISFKNEKPVLATACIGSSLFPETLRILLGHLGQGQSLSTLLSAPPVLINPPSSTLTDVRPQIAPIPIPSIGYDPGFIESLKSDSLPIYELPNEMVSALRGTPAVIAIDPKTNLRTTAQEKGVMLFGGAE